MHVPEVWTRATCVSLCVQSFQAREDDEGLVAVLAAADHDGLAVGPLEQRVAVQVARDLRRPRTLQYMCERFKSLRNFEIQRIVCLVGGRTDKTSQLALTAWRRSRLIQRRVCLHRW